METMFHVGPWSGRSTLLDHIWHPVSAVSLHVSPKSSTLGGLRVGDKKGDLSLWAVADVGRWLVILWYEGGHYILHDKLSMWQGTEDQSASFSQRSLWAGPWVPQAFIAMQQRGPKIYAGLNYDSLGHQLEDPGENHCQMPTLHRSGAHLKGRKVPGCSSEQQSSSLHSYSLTEFRQLVL